MREKINREWYKANRVHGNIGKKRSEETRLKLRISHLGQKAWNKGLKQSEEHRRNNSLSHRCRRQPCKETTKIKIGIANSGINNGQWSGDLVGYQGLHKRMRKLKQKPEYDLCQICFNSYYRLHLANISRKYLTDINDWFYLCDRCHQLYDR